MSNCDNTKERKDIEENQTKNQNDSGLHNTKSEITIQNDNMEEEKEKKEKKLIFTKILIFGIIIIFISVLIVVIIIVVKKRKKKKKFFIDNEKNEEENNTDYGKSDEPTINYEEAEKLIGSEVIKENKYLLINTSNNINESLKICNNINFTKINLTI